MPTTSLGGALRSGLAGAAALTAVHETARRRMRNAPRMDVIGMRALGRTMERVGMRRPPRRRLFLGTLAGDIASNAAWYSLVGLGRPSHVWRRGLLLGLAAGVGAVVLPPMLGLGRSPGTRTPKTQALTVAWYVAGGLAAAAAARVGSPRRLPNRWQPEDPWADDPHGHDGI
jgi:hypothetical protein